MSKKFNIILQSFKDAIFPGRCLACDSLFLKNGISYPYPEKNPAFNDNYSEDEQTARFASLMHPYLCPDCIKDYIPLSSPWCTQCGMMFQETIADDHLCGNCIKTPGKYRILRSAGIYDGSMLSSIRAYKFRKKLQLARPLGLILFMLFRHLYLKYEYLHKDNDMPDLILPVPLHKKRFRNRKFHQVWLMIHDWKKLADNLNHKLTPDIRNDILLKEKMTIPQTGLDRKARKTNIKGAFLVKKPETVTGKKVLLVDDVYTTGATAEECAKELLKAGAEHVDILTLARTQVV